MNMAIIIIIIFLHVYSFSTSEVSVLFNISSSHSNTYLPINRFLHEQFLVSKYSLISRGLLYSQSHVRGFHM